LRSREDAQKVLSGENQRIPKFQVQKERNLGEVLGSRVEKTYYSRGLLQPTVSTMNLKERNMDSERKGSEAGNFHKNMKEIPMS
jgi:hypothetical protein